MSPMGVYKFRHYKAKNVPTKFNVECFKIKQSNRPHLNNFFIKIFNLKLYLILSLQYAHFGCYKSR